ncbi:NUDIX domain-containing protein [Aestuariivirga sp.]|uniref:NUDIX domain-containing protein n=1 Tax=Aestuariivirga sp. TaxID=2650926 RepID=UPI003919EE4E
MLDDVKRLLYRAAKPALHPLYRQIRGLTLGTRTLVLKEGDQEVLLVRHGYAPGWLLPGGGVERGETIFEAAVRELLEEAAVEAEEEPRLHGLYLNERQFRGDHVACLVLRKFRRGEFQRGFEIAEARFFPVSALPEGTTGGTRRRIAEVTQGVALSREW